MTALLADSLGGSAYSYPLSTRLAKVGRFPWAHPSGAVVLCSSCGDRPVVPRSTLCYGCQAVHADAAAARRKARQRMREGVPCRGCGGVKPPGRRRVYCDRCKAHGGAKGKATTEGLRRCERCPNPTRSPHAKLCIDCKAKANQANAAYKRAWYERNGSPPSGPKSAETVRMSRRLAADRRGAVLEPAPPIMSGSARVDSDSFPALPAGPLTAMVLGLIRRTALDSVYAVDVAAGIPGDRGSQVSVEGLHRAGAVSVRRAVCERLGLSDKALQEWGNGLRPSVSFDVADRVLTRAGWLWWMVWEPCDVGCDSVFGPSCRACHGHALAAFAFEGEARDAA